MLRLGLTLENVKKVLQPSSLWKMEQIRVNP